MNFVQDFGSPAAILFCMAGFLALLGMASAQDIRTKQVSNSIWALAALWYLVWWLVLGETFSLSPILFWLLQELFFCRFYGRADCHAFSSCGFFLSLMGGSMVSFLIQMLLSLGFLALVQLLRRNINRRGNLRHPVAFMPYITAGFVGAVLWLGN